MVTEDSAGRKKGLRSFWQKRSVKILACITLFFVALVFSIPFGIKVYLQKWLIENGADIATIDKVRLNLFTGVAGLEGVNVEKDGKTVFANSTTYLNVGLKNLFSQEAHVQEATLTDVLIDIEKLPNGDMRIGSISAGAQDNVASTGPSVQLPDQVEEELSWIFRARTINLQNVAVHYRQPDLDVDLLIEVALIEHINTDPDDREGSLTLKAIVNGAPVNLDLHILVVAPEVDVQGKVAVGGFQLQDLAGFLGQYLKPFAGGAALDGEVAFALKKNNDLKVDYKGQIELDKGDIGGDGWATKGTLTYNGAASFAMTEDNMEVDVDGNLRALEAAFDMPDPVIDIDNSDIEIDGRTMVTIAEEVVVDTDASLKLAPTSYEMDILKTSTGTTTWQGKVLVETGTDSKDLVVGVDGALAVADPSYSMPISGALMEVANKAMAWNGKVEYRLGPGDNGQSSVRTDGILNGEGVTFKLPEVIEIDQKKLNLEGKTEILLAGDVAVSYQGKMQSDEVALNMEAISLSDKQLTWSGKAGYTLGSENQTISATGSLKEEGFHADVADMQISQESLALEPDFSLTLADKPLVKGNLSLAGRDTVLQKGESEMLRLAAFSMENAKGKEDGSLVVEALLLDDLVIPTSDSVPVSLEISSIAVENIESADLVSGNVAQIQVEQSKVADGENGTELATLALVTAKGIQLSKEMQVTVNEVGTSGGVFLSGKGKDPLATLGKLDATDIVYSAQDGVVISSVDLDAVYGNFVRTKTPESQKKSEEKEKSPSGKEKEVTTNDPKAKKVATSYPVAIQQVNITGDSGFKFTDKSLTKTFITLFAIKTLQVNDIDLSNPEHKFSYTLKGSFDKYSPVEITGTAAPLAANIMVEQAVSLKNYSMLHASPYAVEAIGTFFPSGNLDYTSTLKLGEGMINLKNNLLFRELEIETVDAELASQLNNQLPVPLDLALTMLRDNDGSIDLDIPIDGKLSDINIGLADIIITALSKGITVAVTPYLAYTFLGPAGAIAYAGAKVGQAMLDTDLPSLEFELGEGEITKEHQQILAKVGKKIKDDKETIYRICAKVSVAELTTASEDSEVNQATLQNEAIRKELLELGESRSLAVKQYLRSNFKIDDEKLLICNPGLEFEKKNKPRVEFKK